METIYIYGLKCPTDNVIRYVGKSIDPEKRLKGHVSGAKNYAYDHHTARWIRKLISSGSRPELVLLHKVGENERWQDVERAFIASAVERGWKLTNSTRGGEGLDYINGADRAWWLLRCSIAQSAIWDEPGRREEQGKRSQKNWNREIACSYAYADEAAMAALEDRPRASGPEAVAFGMWVFLTHTLAVYGWSAEELQREVATPNTDKTSFTVDGDTYVWQEDHGGWWKALASHCTMPEFLDRSRPRSNRRPVVEWQPPRSLRFKKKDTPPCAV
jgi:predicted GIY-YIG superfamily endonuclease